MKKLWVIFLAFISLQSGAGEMGTYLDLVNSIDVVEREAAGSNQLCAQCVISYSKRMILATDQAIAETIMFMVAESELNEKPIFCFPDGFTLDGSIVEQLVAEGFKNSSLPIDKKRSVPVSAFAIMELHRKYLCDNKKSV